MTDPTPAPRELRLDDPRLVAFLPMLYVAWADGELEPEELALVRDELEAAGTEAGALDRWLDPANPPESVELIDLLGTIRRRAADLSEGERASLAAVGIAIAIQVVVATLVGAMLPLGARLMRQDPALVSGPALTTLVDISGLFIYFQVCTLFFGLR